MAAYVHWLSAYVRLAIGTAADGVRVGQVGPAHRVCHHRRQHCLARSRPIFRQHLHWLLDLGSSRSCSWLWGLLLHSHFT